VHQQSVAAAAVAATVSMFQQNHGYSTNPPSSSFSSNAYDPHALMSNHQPNSASSSNSYTNNQSHNQNNKSNNLFNHQATTGGLHVANQQFNYNTNNYLAPFPNLNDFSSPYLANSFHSDFVMSTIPSLAANSIKSAPVLPNETLMSQQSSDVAKKASTSKEKASKTKSKSSTSKSSSKEQMINSAGNDCTIPNLTISSSNQSLANAKQMPALNLAYSNGYNHALVSNPFAAAANFYEKTLLMNSNSKQETYYSKSNTNQTDLYNNSANRLNQTTSNNTNGQTRSYSNSTSSQQQQQASSIGQMPYSNGSSYANAKQSSTAPSYSAATSHQSRAYQYSENSSSSSSSSNFNKLSSQQQQQQQQHSQPGLHSQRSASHTFAGLNEENLATTRQNANSNAYQSKAPFPNYMNTATGQQSSQSSMSNIHLQAQSHLAQSTSSAYAPNGSSFVPPAAQIPAYASMAANHTAGHVHHLNSHQTHHTQAPNYLYPNPHQHVAAAAAVAALNPHQAMSSLFSSNVSNVFNWHSTI